MTIAGNDTSALTTSHAILLLAMHPNIQERVMAEIEEVFASITVDEPITNEHVTELIYLEQVLRETLRLLPPVPFLLRKCTADTKMRECVIPNGALVYISIYRHPYAFMAFSRASRECLGVRYAITSMKIMLVSLLRRYKFRTHLKMADLRT